MRFILYSMIVDAIANLPAYGRELEKFRLDRRIDGFFGKRPMLGRLVGKVFAELHQRSSDSRTRDGWPEEETIVLPACESRPSFGENQPGPPIRTAPFVRVSAASGLR